MTKISKATAQALAIPSSWKSKPAEKKPAEKKLHVDQSSSSTQSDATTAGTSTGEQQAVSTPTDMSNVGGAESAVAAATAASVGSGDPSEQVEKSAIAIAVAESFGIGVPSAAVEKIAICSSCKQLVVQSDPYHVGRSDGSIYGCKACSALQKRLSRVLKDKALASDWPMVKSADRESFFKGAHFLVGSQLAAYTSKAVQKVKGSKIVHSFSKKSEWMDEEEIREKFKHRPIMVESILANAETIQCPIRNVDMFEVPTFTSAETHEHTEVTTSTDTTSQSGKRKGCSHEGGMLKAIKASVEPAQLPKEQIDKLASGKDRLAPLVKNSRALMAQAVSDDAKCMVPEHVVNSANVSIIEVEALEATINLVATEPAVFKDVQGKTASVGPMLREAVRKLSLMLSEAGK
eukprot:TRINITY_DN77223_c0_g1_i1.p1 TRINITY_DN77223_c0_g1~~TRINITY_DN77223_c0_g1_i1.p1  ORF type:complete len:405 (+),score=93.72 TRINITY_DN77223_c0_g1_i1:61-1275(+)